jgi:hypothetical protein
MAKNPDRPAASLETENTGGLLSGFLAEEDALDRRALWRLGSWGAASVGALVLAVYANQSSISFRREQAASADLARQAQQQIQSVAKESQNEARRLASAIDTLNGDRDRLYSRVTVLEQGLESVTGAIAKQQAAAPPWPSAAPALVAIPSMAPPAAIAPAPVATAATTEPQPAAAQNPAPAPAVSPVATTAPKTVDKSAAAPAVPEPPPATVASVAPKTSNPPAAAAAPATAPAVPLVAAKSMMAPPDAAATKLIEPEKSEKPEKSDKPAKAITAAPMPEIVASASPAGDAEPDTAKVAPPQFPVQRTEFGVDVGGANSVGGLRALWRGLLKSRSNAALTTLRPIIVIREGSNGLGMQLRLVAGPLDDAAAAAKICAGMIENERPCETAVFDGQRLAVNADEPAATAKPAPARSSTRRRGYSRRAAVEEPAKKPDPPPSTLSTFFRR